MTVTFEVYPPLATAFGGTGQGDPSTWSEEVASGETLGRVLTRLVAERPGFERLYRSAARLLASDIHLAVNGRNYELMGGMTYLLRDSDRFSFTTA